ncbi:MAG: molecular chaperone DnaJ [Gammaproteobacteria bacterium]|nr:molecular chaperone DnaJ [Gammaproteobacteria bacterium]MCF6260426.1 molecular chaperone DnaJ [Gammaproteobacteria bacterium]
MNANTSSTQQLFLQRLLEVLRAHPAGISEYELIRTLDSVGEPHFDANCLRDSLSLFQTHFFLFHNLYQLHDQLWRNDDIYLEIGPLRIQLLSGNTASYPTVSAHNPLRDYYLNIDNLNNTDANDVELLLGKFWQRFVRNDERHNALEELGLNDPVDWTTIKTRHRRLVIEHHPDRGGNKQRLQAINAAMDVLTRNSRH